MHKRLAALSAMAIAVTFAFVPGTVTASFSLESTMQSAATARRVPLPLLKAITYVNTRWELVVGPAGNGGYGLMNILPSQLAHAASLSGHSAAQIMTDPAANLDAGAALLASANSGATDLASWQPATALILGPVVATQVYDALRSGESRTTSYGELITLAPQRLPAPTPPSALGVGSGATVSGAAALAPATTTTPGSDYPPATWVPASPDNYSTANRPHDYPVDMIIIHDTEGSYGSAIQEFQNPATQASAHYVVSDLGQITQMVAEHDIAWHAGNWDYNTRSIGIEHEGYAWTNGWYTWAMYDASAQLAASICSRWGVPMDRQHVIGHSEVPDPNNPGQFGGSGHHTDPGPYWDWTYYMSKAQAVAATLPSPPHMMLDPLAVQSDGVVTLSWPAAQSCRGAIARYHVVSPPAAVAPTLPGTATSATITGLQAGVSYKFTVTATNSYGQDTATSNAVPWAAQTNFAGPVASGPTVSSWSSDRMDVFYKGTDGQLYHRFSQGNSGWSPQEPLGGVLTSAPAAVSWGPNRIDVFVRGTDLQMWHKFWAGAWSNWEPLGGVLTSAPAVASWSQNRLDVFVRGTDQQMWHKFWAGGWSNWEPLGGNLGGTPAAVSWGANRIDVVIVGMDSHISHRWWDTSSWSTWEAQGGTFSSAPAISSWDFNRLDVFGLNAAGGLQHKTWTGSGWTTWQDIGAGSWHGDPAAIGRYRGYVDVFSQATDSTLWYLVFRTN